jgi:antitoxin SocA-like protein
MDLAILIPGIATFIRSKEGAATKTKLLKLLYLLDIESFREKHETLTGFDWIFYKYGPWTAQYDDVLDQLSQAGKIRLNNSSRADLDAIFVDPTNTVELSKAFPSYTEELKARRILEVWADRPLGELLDYVYFHTAPMRDAERKSRLDFESILREETPVEYRRSASKSSPDELKKKRREFLKAIASAPKVTGGQFIEPSYGKDYWSAIETMEREPD